MARLRIDAVRFHNLYAVKNTVLASRSSGGEVTLMEPRRYIRTLVDFLELLPPTTIVERISGDARRTILSAQPGASISGSAQGAE